MKVDIITFNTKHNNFNVGHASFDYSFVQDLNNNIFLNAIKGEKILKTL